MTLFRTWAAACALLAPLAAAQDSVSLASKSISQVYAVQNRVFAFAADGASFSRIDFFAGPVPQVVTRDWPLQGAPSGGAAWGASLLLRGNHWPNDSQRVARVASLRYDGGFRGADSLVFRDPMDTTIAIAEGAVLSALAVRETPADTFAVLGFGRLGVALARLRFQPAPAQPRLFADSIVRFLAFPSDADTALPLDSCRWNRLCRIDTVAVPAAGLDSVISVAIDSSAPDSVWLLVGTQRGLRRGLWGGNSFPYRALPGVGAAGTEIHSILASPARGLLWAFAPSRFFLSLDHGATFLDSAALDAASDPNGTLPSSLQGRVSRPTGAFAGDTTFLNLNQDRPGLVAFHRDTLLRNTGSRSDGGDVRIDHEDGLDIRAGEGSLTTLAVATHGGQSVLVVGSTLKGVFYRRLDQPGTAFSNLNRLRVLQGGLAEVITYPTLFTGRTVQGAPEVVQIGYRLGKDANVTITVLNSAMEKVRVLVRNAPRRGGIARSENLAEDFWDGRDEGGRLVSVGVYYILVESDRGEKAFGKVIAARGRK